MMLLDTPFAAGFGGGSMAGIAVAFGGGVLASFSPCLYPMIPVTVSIIGGTERSTRAGRLALALVYVLGLAATYAALGVAAGLTGTMFGSVSTNPWLYFLMANVMLLAAAMTADVIPVPIPERLLARAATVGRGGQAAGVFVMGIASGLVAAPCGAPVMAAILTWVTTTGSAALGFAYLFAFSLGMCAVLMVVAAVADTAVRLPRPGPWMVWVKRFLALVLLGVAEYYLISMGQLIV